MCRSKSLHIERRSEPKVSTPAHNHLPPEYICADLEDLHAADLMDKAEQADVLHVDMELLIYKPEYMSIFLHCKPF